ncbi:hypothetical protein Tco_1038382 [Tanacetum coccineum]
MDAFIANRLWLSIQQDSSVLRQQNCDCFMLQQRSTLKSKAHRCTLPFYKGAGGEWNCGTLLCSDGISTGRHLHQTFATRKIPLLDQKARYAKHVSGNAKTSDRGTRRVMVLTPCYHAFLITAEVPQVYMHQFWNTIHKIKDTNAYRFKLDKKKFQVNTDVFHKILQICPRLPNQAFVVTPSEEELVTFIQELGYYGKCDMLSAIHTKQMHQPWRTFVAIINRCISGKTTRLDRLMESRAQILWGMYNNKNVDYVALL